MRVTVLGLGSAGRRHAENLLARGHSVTGFDPGPAEAPEEVRRVADLGVALDGAEAVVVASPNVHHADQAIAVLERGLPVLVEKPLAIDVGAARRVVDLARDMEVPCGVAMNLRFHPAMIALRELLESGELGTIHLAQVSFGYDLRRWRKRGDYRRSYSARSDLGGGIVLDAIHEIDELLWLLGPVETVSAECAQVSDLEVDVEDLAVALLRFRTGALGLVDLNFFETAYRRGCLLVGERATARWDWAGATITVEGEDPARRLEVPAEVKDTYVAVLDDFLESVAGGAPTRTSFEEGFAAVRVCEAIKRAGAEGRRLSPEE